MKTLLRLDSSADLMGSRTRRMTTAFADEWAAIGSDRKVISRDLHRDQIPHLETWALHFPEHERPAPVPAEAAALQRELIDELLSADVLLIGVPVYNFSMPSTLKAWVDRVHVPGELFAGIQPLAGRPAVLVTTSGLAYDPGSATEGWEHAVAALRVVLADSFGMDVTVVEARYSPDDPDAEHAARAASDLAAALDLLPRLARQLG